MTVAVTRIAPRLLCARENACHTKRDDRAGNRSHGLTVIGENVEAIEPRGCAKADIIRVARMTPQLRRIARDSRRAQNTAVRSLAPIPALVRLNEHSFGEAEEA
jgi:hypothetical protein